MNQADAGDQPGAVNVPLVHAERGERADFEKRRTGIDKASDAFPGKQLAAADVPVARLGRTALGGGSAARLQFVDQAPPGSDIRIILIRWRRQPAHQSCHVACFSRVKNLVCPGDTMCTSSPKAPYMNSTCC